MQKPISSRVRQMMLDSSPGEAALTIMDAIADIEIAKLEGSYPISVDSFASCAYLVENFPQAEAVLPRMVEVPGWRGFVRNWDRLTEVLNRDMHKPTSNELHRLIMGIILENEMGPAVRTSRQASLVAIAHDGDGLIEQPLDHLLAGQRICRSLTEAKACLAIPNFMIQRGRAVPFDDNVQVQELDLALGTGGALVPCQVFTRNEFPLNVTLTTSAGSISRYTINDLFDSQVRSVQLRKPASTAGSRP